MIYRRWNKPDPSLTCLLPKMFHGTRSRGSRGDLILFTLVARALGDCHGLGAGSRCSFTLHSAGSLGTDTGPWLSPARGLGRRGSSSSRLREPRTGEPHSRWERFEAGKRHRGSGKLTAALCSPLLESFLHLLLSPRVICTQIKHGW